MSDKPEKQDKPTHTQPTMEDILKIIEKVREPSILERLALENEQRRAVESEAAKVSKADQRRENSEMTIREKTSKQALQKACLHIRKTNRSSAAVLDKQNNFFVCQICRVVVFPGPEPSDPLMRIPDAIYDTTLYNYMIQTASQTDL